MKKLVILATLAFAGAASAGEYHVSKYLLCSDCHSMHGSQQHKFGSADAPGVGADNAALNGDWQYSTTTVYKYLLKGAESESCMACHDGKTFAPDVVGPNANGYARSAGGIADGDTGYETFKGHTMDVSAVAPGSNGAPASVLTCFSCHIQHGQANNYRNLGNRAADQYSPTYTINTDGVLDTTRDVTITVTTAAFDATGSGTRPNGWTAQQYIPQVDGVFGGYYDMSKVQYAALAGVTTGAVDGNRMNNFCAKCHGDFHGNPGAGAVDATDTGATGGGVGGYLASGAAGDDVAGWEQFTRHPTSGVRLGGLLPVAPATSNHGHTAAGNLQGKVSRVKAAKTGADFTSSVPLCISCHNAHGSTHAFGLRYLVGTTAVSNDATFENGNGSYINLCNQCHSQGISTRASYPGTVNFNQ